MGKKARREKNKRLKRERVLANVSETTTPQKAVVTTPKAAPRSGVTRSWLDDSGWSPSKQDDILKATEAALTRDNDNATR